MTINPTIPTVGSPRGSEEIDVANALTTIVDAVNKGTGPSLVASLPLAPVDGQEVYFLADAVNGIVWHLKYRAASPSAYKWEYVGGTHLTSVVAAAESTTSLAYADLGTVGPDVTVPLAGDYDVDVSFEGSHSAVAAQAIMSYAVGATAASDDDRAMTISPTANAVLTAHRVRRKLAIAAATVIRSKYKGGTAGTALFSRRQLRVRPVRVG